MPASFSMIKTFSYTVKALLILYCAVFLPACGFWKNDPAPPPIASTVVPTDSGQLMTSFAPTTKTVEFTIDTTRSTGTIDLSIDPKGGLLGSRKAHDTAALKGKVIVRIQEDRSTGKQQISLQDIRLTNIKGYDMDFTWGALVGNINVRIARNVLQIIPNHLSHTSLLSAQDTFVLPQSYFSVLGYSQVKGSGLVLTKAVGNKKVNLTMKKTEPVTLRGTIKMIGNQAILHIPRAVLHDQFDLDGTQLGLVFTADITATAQNL